jgi:hypothetical protein
MQTSSAPPFSFNLITVNSFASAVEGENPSEPRFPIRRRPSSYAPGSTERATRSSGFSRATSERSRGSQRGRCDRSGGSSPRSSPSPTSDSDSAPARRAIFASSNRPRSYALLAGSPSISTDTPTRPTSSSSSTRWLRAARRSPQCSISPKRRSSASTRRPRCPRRSGSGISRCACSRSPGSSRGSNIARAANGCRQTTADFISIREPERCCVTRALMARAWPCRVERSATFRRFVMVSPQSLRAAARVRCACSCRPSSRITRGGPCVPPPCCGKSWGCRVAVGMDR